MVRYSCLIAQKETKDRNKMKCLLTCCDVVPEEFVAQLQENHCLEYQLVVYSFASDQLLAQLTDICKDKKTGYGKNWYEFTDVDLAFIISTYFANGKVVFDFTSITNACNFTFNLMSNDEEKIVVDPSATRSNVTLRYDVGTIKELNNYQPVSEFSQYETETYGQDTYDQTNTVYDETTEESVQVDTKKERRHHHRRKRRSDTDFEITVKNDVIIPKSAYVRFIEDKCLKDKEGKIYTVRLNDNFIDYICDLGTYNVKDFSTSTEREALFKGFTKLGYEPVENGKRYYIHGLRLKPKSV